jgi:hypothetical protein
MQHLPVIFAGSFSIHFVAKHRVPDGMEMHANLVCSSCVNLAKDQNPSACFLNDLESRVSRAASIEDGHFLTMHWMPTDRLGDFTCRFRESSAAQGQVKFLDFSSGKLVA